MNRIIEALDDVMPLARLFIGGNEEGTRQEAVTISAFYTRLLEIAVHGVDLAKRFEWITNDLDTEIVARAFLGSFQAVILHPLARGEITAEQAKKRAPVLIDLSSGPCTHRVDARSSREDHGQVGHGHGHGHGH
jgi:hypothetical protein